MLRFAPWVLLVPAAAAQGHFERTVPASPSPDLYVTTGSGHLHVTPGSGSEIHIVAMLKPANGAGGDVQDRIRQIVSNPPVTVSGDTIRVGDFTGDRHALYDKIEIDYDISAPARVAVNLRSGSGDLIVDHLGRYAKADTGSGSIRVDGLAGPADLRSGSGDIALGERGQGDVHAETGSGSIHLENLAGALQARSGSGDIEVRGQILGASTVKTGSGSVQLHLGQGARLNLDATTGSGRIRLAPPSAAVDNDRHHLATELNGGGPALRVVTGSGDITLN